MLMRRSLLTALILSTVVPLLGCNGGPAPPPFKAVVDNKTLMSSIVEKQANIVWESVGLIDTAQGTEELRPHTDAEWTNIREAAVTITEAGNLLMLVPRAQDAGEWMKRSADLIAQGERIVTAIDRRNPQDVFDVGADLYEACVNCHRQYMPGVKEQYR